MLKTKNGRTMLSLLMLKTKNGRTMLSLLVKNQDSRKNKKQNDY